MNEQKQWDANTHKGPGDSSPPDPRESEDICRDCRQLEKGGGCKINLSPEYCKWEGGERLEAERRSQVSGGME